MRLNRISHGNQSVATGHFEARSKENTRPEQAAVKSRTIFRQIPRGASGNFTRGNYNRRVRRWQTSRAALANGSGGDTEFPIFRLVFCKGFSMNSPHPYAKSPKRNQVFLHLPFFTFQFFFVPLHPKTQKTWHLNHLSRRAVHVCEDDHEDYIESEALQTE